MAVHEILILLLLLLLFVFPAISSSQNEQIIADSHPLVVQLREATIRLARLESILEESIVTMNAKNIYMKEQEERIQDMEIKIKYLQTSLLSLKTDSLQNDVLLDTLEAEVRSLWAASRQNNFDLHFLKSKAQDADNRLEAATSQVEKISDIVTEQWIQIQQLEQALHMTDMRVLKTQRHVRPRYSFMKFIDDFSGEYLPNLVQMLRQHLFGKESSLMHFLQQLQRVFFEVQKYHHQLQGFVRREMERNELTAPYANKEVVFFVASAIFTFPIYGAWMFLAS